MYLTLKEYKILSDFYFLNCNNAFYKKMALSSYKSEKELDEKTACLLDSLWLRNKKQTVKNGGRVLEKRNAGKERARQLAINWQNNLANRPGWSWQWCCQWRARWERIGRKYRLMREFKENGII